MSIFFAVILLLLIHLLLLINLQFTAWPEMLSYPYLLSKGLNLYKDIALPYQPLLPVFQSFYFGIFGYNLLSLKLLTWGVILFSDILIFLISIKLISKKFLAYLPLLLFIFLQTFFQGNGLWFDLALTPFVLLAIYFFINFQGQKGIFLLAFFLMVASLIKQQAAVYFIFLFVFFVLFWKKKKLNLLIWFFLGALIPATFTILYVLSKGILSDYLFWTINVPLIWYPKFSGYIHFPNLKDLTLLLLIFGPGLILSIINPKKDLAFYISLLIFLALFLTSFSRFELFRLQHALAVYCILLTLSLRNPVKNIALILLPIALGAILLLYGTQSSFGKSARFFSDQDIKLSNEIKNYSKDERIYLLGVFSTVYPVANLIPPKPWVDNYVWYFEITGVQEKFLDGFSKDPPKFIFRKPPQRGSWDDLGTYEPKKVIKYMEDYFEKDGNLTNGVEIWKRKD